MTLADCRRFYAQEIKFLAHLASPPLVEAFARVPRERFVGPPPWHVASGDQFAWAGVGSGGGFVTTDDPEDLYHNVLISLDRARNLNNGQPSALARWINALDLKAGDRVFHVGCGVGYYTAIIAEVVGPEGKVMACEVDAGLAAQARDNLGSYGNITVQWGDGAVLDPGLCDATFINAGVTHPHRSWLDRLPQNGRMVLPLTATTPGANVGSGVMAKIVREQGGLSAQAVSLVGIYSCTSVRDPELEPLLAKALASRALLKMKSVRLDQHEQTETCLVHGRDVCLSAPSTPRDWSVLMTDGVTSDEGRRARSVLEFSDKLSGSIEYRAKKHAERKVEGRAFPCPLLGFDLLGCVIRAA